MAFPTTGILDSFAGANEDPIDTGWDGTAGHVFFAGDSGLLAKISNQLTNQTGGGTDTSSGYDASSFNGDVEIWITIATASAVAGDAFKLGVMNAFNTPGADGYELHVEKAAGADIWRIRRRDNVTPTQLGADMNQEIASGDSIGMSVSGGVITAYYKSGAGAWAVIGTRSDSTYTGPWYLGVKTVQASPLAWKADDFGGGLLSAPVGGVFPSTTLLDDFTRANNASLGANWTEAVNSKNNRAEIISNAVSVTGTGTSSICAYTGTGAISSLSLAVQATATVIPTGVTDALGLGVTKVSDTTRGYHAEVNVTGTDVGVTFWNDFAGTQIGSTITATGFGQLVAGNLMGLIVYDRGTQVDLEFWIFKGGIWTKVAAMSATGTDYIPGPYYPALRVKYSTESVDDFRAGLVSAPVSSGRSSITLLGVG